MISKSFKMRRIVIFFLIFVSLILFSSAFYPGFDVQAQANNQISILYAVVQGFRASGNSFTDTEVSGIESRSSNFSNTIDSTNEPVKNLTTSLNNDKVIRILNPPPDSYGPPTYQWSFGEISQNPMPDWAPQVVVGLNATDGARYGVSNFVISV
jgi:hypothetical protein